MYVRAPPGAVPDIAEKAAHPTAQRAPPLLIATPSSARHHRSTRPRTPTTRPCLQPPPPRPPRRLLPHRRPPRPRFPRSLSPTAAAGTACSCTSTWTARAGPTHPECRWRTRATRRRWRACRWGWEAAYIWPSGWGRLGVLKGKGLADGPPTSFGYPWFRAEWAGYRPCIGCDLCTHASRLPSLPFRELPSPLSIAPSPNCCFPQGRSIEFVINNGAGEWDSPPGGPGRNYTITAPGQYRLHYGTITQTAPWSP